MCKTPDDFLRILSTPDHKLEQIFEHAREVRNEACGARLHLRGLIETNNFCRKNCYYCGIRKSNKKLMRYKLDDESIINVVQQARNLGLHSILLQTGEQKNSSFIKDTAKLLEKLVTKFGADLNIGLSCGEQTPQTYKQWFQSGAKRYLLRMETFDQTLYQTIHPKNPIHSYDTRYKCLEELHKIGYQIGSGILVGLPGQNLQHIATDLYELKKLDIDMLGIGPYIPHPNTPLFSQVHSVWEKDARIRTTLLATAALRISMPDINISSTTALEQLSPGARVQALKSGANVVMINFTPPTERSAYELYPGKEEAGFHQDNYKEDLELLATETELQINWTTNDDPIHYRHRRSC